MNNSTQNTLAENSAITLQGLITRDREKQTITSQLLSNLTTPQRLKKELTDLLKNDNFTTTAYPINNKTYPYAVDVTFYDNNTEYMTVICEIPYSYPFKAPLISLKTTDAQLSEQDLTSIADNTNKKLLNWHPTMRIQEVITTHVSDQIRTYKDKKLASQMIAQGHVRTIDQIKEKYLSKTAIGVKYPKLQEKLNGLWAKKTPDGYFIFHIEGDYINMAFEPFYAGDAPLSYHATYSAGIHIENDNQFNIRVNDAADSNIINNFRLIFYNDLISIQFVSLKHNSILHTIISKFETDYRIGEAIALIQYL